MTSIRKQISILLIASLLFTCFALFPAEAQAASSNGKYWLKVNEQQNVVTAYKRIDSKWKPVRAMLCSTGLNGTTPRGTFYTQGKWNWGTLMNNVYGQYCTHITSDILFHSVYYTKRYDKASQVTSQFNKLGKRASHGCVRLSVLDAKWIYNVCQTGTKVTIYRSSNPGPLGKPAPIKVSEKRYRYWDPTDPDSRNPYHIIKKPVIRVSDKKKRTIQYGSKYRLKNYVNAKDPNTFMNLKDHIKVSQVRKYSPTKKQYVKDSFSTEKLGTYKVTYSVKAPYSKTAYTTIKIRVTDNIKAPVISGAKNKTVTAGTVNAVAGVTAKQPSTSRTNAIQVHIKEPGSSEYRLYTYSEASNYIFETPGVYTVRYTVKNRYSPYKESTKTVTVTVKEPEPAPQPDPLPELETSPSGETA